MKVSIVATCTASRCDGGRLMMLPRWLPRMSQNRDWLMVSQLLIPLVFPSPGRVPIDMPAMPAVRACAPRHVQCSMFHVSCNASQSSSTNSYLPLPLSLVSTSSTPQVQPTMSATAEDLFGSSSDSEEELLGAAKEAATTKKTPPAASAAASGKLAVLGHLSCYE